MELELKRAELDTYETGGEVMATQEETAETIVPDYCPDIARIIDTDGKVYLHSREIRDGKAELDGTVRVTVLYTPDGEAGIRTLEFSIPFHVETDSRLLQGCQHLTAETETELLETRMLNPRKVFTRCRLVSRLNGYRKTKLQLCTGLECEPALCVEKRTDVQNATFLTRVTEKDFTFTDELHLSPGREGAAEVLNSRLSWVVSETKIVGSKLIFKGVLSVCVLYRAVDGRCCSTMGELPFSQIMEVDGTAETADVSLHLQITGCSVQIDGDDPEGRQLAVTVYLHATALLREAQEVTLLTDLYSTAYETSYDASPLLLTEFCQSMNRRQTMREVLEIGVVAESLLSASVHCGAVNVSREGNYTVLRTNAAVKVFYLDEGGVPLMTERSMEVACQLEVPEDCRIRARADCTEEVQGSLGDRGIEVRFPVDFSIEAEKQAKKVCISAVKLRMDAPKDTVGTPSLVLRCIGKDETVWDLAKKHNTTIGAILAANQLEEEALPHDKLLLIPRKRA